MKIYQILPSLRYGDAVGNDAMTICDVISQMGYETGIYAMNIDKRLSSPHYKFIEDIPKLADDDIVILNHCSGTELVYKFMELGGRKMMIYHNITPPEFFKPYNRDSYTAVKEGYRQTELLKDEVEYVMSISKYNAMNLREMGYTCPIGIRPILVAFDDYKKAPDDGIIAKYSNDGYTNIVFVGRIAPNKKQEDIIQAFAYYKKNINPKSRLIFVGGDGGMERYGRCLKNYVDALMLDDVIFTGHIKFSEILAYYKIADVFLCMSEHEGFCVPLVEAMFFDVPIIAYKSSAIPDTLGDSGILVDNKDPVFVAKIIDRLVNDETLKKQIIEKQRVRLADFGYENIKKRFEEIMLGFINKEYVTDEI